MVINTKSKKEIRQWNAKSEKTENGGIFFWQKGIKELYFVICKKTHDIIRVSAKQ
jgi:hypothetical protein